MLLAKSLVPGRPELSLVDHCRDTEQAAAAIFRPGSRWANAWTRFFCLDEQASDRFLLNLRIAALFHDIGKANAEFQALMLGRGGTQGAQTLRHEHISALVLAIPEVREWLERNSALDVDVITAAVLSHHLKASDQGSFRWGQPCSPRPRIALHLDHPEVAAILERVRDLAGLEGVPLLPAAPWSLAAPWNNALASGSKRARELARAVRGDSSRKGLLLAVKAGVIVADTVASGVFRTGGTIDRWIEDVVHIGALSADDITRKIIEPRITQISSRTGAPFHFHRFQTLTAEQGRRALLIAGCGTGKTLAAWKWAERRAREEPIGRVIFLYPTRGTATEGFRDYVGWAPEAEAALLHGTAAFELEAMMDNPPESMQGKDASLDEHQARMFALGYWPRRFFSATVDQFLGFMEHRYTGLCLLPALADSAVIFDEIHSYDRRMFDALLGFLESFDVPVLCMTATLPPDRRDDLVQRGGLRAFPDESHREELADLEQQELRPRYCVAAVDGPPGALERAVTAYRAGQRVLWVVNTVSRCQGVADMLKRALDFEPLVYHSRFRLCDRKHAHERTIKAFRSGAGAAIAVTTQVCEMSLDLDADMLITEVAPVTSVVQRFGRSNRSSLSPADRRSTVLWYSPEGHKPYMPDELHAGRALLEDLGSSEVSQRGLAQALERHAPAGPRADGSSAPFLIGGYYAVPGSLREETDFTVTAVLERDVEELLASQRNRRANDGLLLPVPRRHVLPRESRPSGLPSYLEIAPDRHYSETRGFIAPKED